MFTIKLCRGSVTKLVQADEVNIYPAGPKSGGIGFVGMAPEPKDRTNDIREIATLLGERSAVFYITYPSEPRPKGWSDEAEFFDSAYIENDKGATTQIVRPY